MRVPVWYSCTTSLARAEDRSIGQLNSKGITLPAKFEPPKITTEEDLIRQHTEALAAWHTAKGQAADLRVQHLEDLIQYHMEQRNIKQETAVKQILHWEEVRNLHTQQSSMMTHSKPNVIGTPHALTAYH